VDPRGPATELIDDPTGAVGRLEERTGAQFESIGRAREYTADELERLGGIIDSSALSDRLSLVLCGSYARRELTPGSDDDWALIALEPFPPYDPDVVRAMAACQAQLGQEGKAPGAQDVFGVPFDVETLVLNVGLDADSNTNLTRRMLLLLESHELLGTIHTKAWDQILERYLNYGIKDYRPPRFLLNDIVRYWRTICVDFEGKHAQGDGDDPKWVSRNAKLRTSRKLLYAGGLVPVLLCHLIPAADMRAFLSRWLKAPPTDRLAAAFLLCAAGDEGARTLGAYDRWVALMRNEDAREALKNLRQADRPESPLWAEIHQIGEDFQRGLMALLFSTPLRPLAPQYAIF
jgi:hypothetical protein